MVKLILTLLLRKPVYSVCFLVITGTFLYLFHLHEKVHYLETKNKYYIKLNSMYVKKIDDLNKQKQVYIETIQHLQNLLQKKSYQYYKLLKQKDKYISKIKKLCTTCTKQKSTIQENNNIESDIILETLNEVGKP